MNKKLLIFHPTIAPYRIDFFNDLYKAFETRVCLEYRNLKDQKFDYDKIEAQFAFKPVYLENNENDGIWYHIDDFKPDIVLVSEYGKIALKVILHKFLKCKKYKIISMCDDSYNMAAEGNEFSFKHKIARSIIAPLLNDIVLVDSRATEWYKEHYGKGLYFPIIKPDEKTRKYYANLLEKSEDECKNLCLKGKKVFLFVGRLVALKNVSNAIRAFAKLNQEENVFVIIGDGPEKERLIQLSNELGTNTIFTGRLEGDSLNVWYNIAQIFILPSYLEPFGAVTNEALLGGCKALISEKAGSQCLVKEGWNGYTFDPLNIDEIAEKMGKAASETESLHEIILKDNLMQVPYSFYIDNLVYTLQNLNS